MVDYFSGNDNSFERMQKLLALIPGLQYPGDEGDLLESLGGEYLNELISLMYFQGGRRFPQKSLTRDDREWFGKVLSGASFSSGIKTEELQSIITLGAITAPLMPRFIPAWNKHRDNKLSDAELFEFISDLHRKLMEYWECDPNQLKLTDAGRGSYALGAFMYSLVSTDDSLPLSISDDILFMHTGIQHSLYSQKDAEWLLARGELLDDFFGRRSTEGMQDDYNNANSAEFPTLSFSLRTEIGEQTEVSIDDVSESIGTVRLDRDCAYFLNRIAAKRGLKDASQMSALWLSLFLNPDEIDRPVLTMAAEWSEERTNLLIDMCEDLTEEELYLASGVIAFYARMPRLYNSHENYLQAVHAVRMVPLICKLHLGIEPVEVDGADTAIMLSNPMVEGSSYTEDHHLISQGQVIKFFIENEHDADERREISDELLRWLGENAEDIAVHFETLCEHGRVDRDLFSRILSNSPMASGVL